MKQAVQGESFYTFRSMPYEGLSQAIMTRTISYGRVQEPNPWVPGHFGLGEKMQGSFSYLEGQGDLGSRLITPATHIDTLVILIINLLTKSS